MTIERVKALWSSRVSLLIKQAAIRTCEQSRPNFERSGAKAILVIVFLVLNGCAETIVINRLAPISESEPHSDVILCRKNNFYGYAAGTILSLDGKSLFRSAAAKYTIFRIAPGKHTIGLLGNGPAGPLASEKDFVAENGMAYYFYSNVDTVFKGTEDDVRECFDNEAYEFLKVQ